MTTFTWQECGGSYTIELPEIAAAQLGWFIKLSPIPDTPKWEWAVTNIPATLFPGMTNGYCQTRRQAVAAARDALRFWKARGYQTVSLWSDVK